MIFKNDVLTSIFTIFCQKSSCGATQPAPPLPSSFNAITNHLSAGKVPPGHCPQCGAARVNILISFWLQAFIVRGKAGSQSGPISQSFLVY
jgi:hypothetical protein